MSSAVRIRRLLAGLTAGALVVGGVVTGAASASAAPEPNCFTLGSAPDESTKGCVFTDIAPQFVASSDVTKPGLHSIGSSQLTQGQWGEDAQLTQSADGSLTISYNGSKAFWIRQGGYLLLLDEPTAHLDAEGNGTLSFYARRYPTPDGTFAYGSLVQHGTIEVLTFTGGTPAQSENGFISWPDLTAEWSPEFADLLERPSPSTAFPTAVVDRVREGNTLESPSIVEVSTKALTVTPVLESVSGGAAIVGQEAQFTATMTHPAIIYGTVSLSELDGEDATLIETSEVSAFQNVVDTLHWTAPNAGEFTLRTTYLSNLSNTVGLPSTLEVTAVDPTTTSLSIPSSATAGGTVTATVTVEGVSTLPEPDPLNGEVTFWDGDQLLGSGQAVNGHLSKTLRLPQQGSRPITARFEDQAYFAGSTSDVRTVAVAGTPSSSTLTLAKSSEVYGRSVKLTAKVTGGTGIVRFYDGSTSLGSATISGGTASKTVTLGAGKHRIVARYLGTATVAAVSSSTRYLTVTKASTSKVTVKGSAFTKNTSPKVTVTVAKLDNGAYPVGKVILSVGGKAVKTVDLPSSKKGVVTTYLAKSSKSISVKAQFVPSQPANVNTKYSSTVTITVK